VPIEILESPEPGSGLSIASGIRIALEESQSPILIESEASRMLEHDLRRYCNGELNGRSYLIAGHRGAGKTTLVLNAVQHMMAESVRGKLARRPLLVQLLGPSLLPDQNDVGDSNGAGEKDSTGSTNASSGNKPLGEAKPEVGVDGEKQPITGFGMRHVLEQITLALFRALSRELTRAYRMRVEYAATSNRAQQGELLELAAQLELELDEYPGPNRLRDYWRRLGVLKTGVILPHYGWDPRLQGLPYSADTRFEAWFGGYSRFFINEGDQGMRELVALCSACEAYRRISGTISRKDQSKAGLEEKAERKIEWSGAGKDFLAPLIALLTGGTAGVGVLAGSPSHPMVAALVGLLAALGTSLVMKRSSSATRERSAAREDLFLPDLSVTTLDRVLPVLIDRIRAARLAPFFMVDELDKVAGLSTRITEMVRRLKKLVAESAFFCFLTDRSYFEEMCRRTREMPYSIEYTYYTNQLFVVFSHRDLHEYLGKLLQLREPSTALVGTSLTPSTLSPDANRTFIEEQSDLPILPYILLHAAQMHPFDLRRQLAVIRDDNGRVALAPGLIRSRPRYRFELMIQVAIQLILDDDDMQSELDRQPAFRRLAHDALYHITREWDSGELEFDLGSNEAQEKCFKKYLISRMDTDPQPVRAGQPLVQPNITESDLKFLLQKVQELASLLCNPQAIFKRAKEALFPQIVLNALPLDRPLAPLLTAVDEGKSHRYRWNFHRSGRPAQRIAGVAPAAIPLQDLAFVKKFAEAIADLTKGAVDPSTLSSQFGIIATSPAWSDVQRAVSRLSKAEPEQSYPEQEIDVAVLADYARLVRKSSKSIALSLYCANVLGKLTRGNTPSEFIAGLDLIARAFKFRHLPEDAVLACLSELFDQIHIRFPADSPLPLPPALDQSETVKNWLGWIAESVTVTAQKISEPKDELDRSKQASWMHQFERFKGSSDGPLNLEDIICALWKRGPFSLLEVDLSSMTARQWSAAFAYAVLGRSPVEGEPPPPLWLAGVALGQLGFTDHTRPLAESGWSTDLAEKLMGGKNKTMWQAIFEHSHRASSSHTGIIITSADSVAAGWASSPAGAVLVFDTALLVDLLTVLEPLREEFNKWLNLRWLIFDLTAVRPEEKIAPPEDRDQMRIRRFLGFEPQRDDSRPIVILLRRDQPHPDFAVPPRYLSIAAQNLNDLLKDLPSPKAKTPPMTGEPTIQRRKSSSVIHRKMK